MLLSVWFIFTFSSLDLVCIPVTIKGSDVEKKCQFAIVSLEILLHLKIGRKCSGRSRGHFSGVMISWGIHFVKWATWMVRSASTITKLTGPSCGWIWGCMIINLMYFPGPATLFLVCRVQCCRSQMKHCVQKKSVKPLENLHSSCRWTILWNVLLPHSHILKTSWWRQLEKWLSLQV